MPVEELEVITGKRSPLVPPRRIDLSGDQRPGDFEAIGQEFLGHFIELGGLCPQHAVLDVGSGCGRIAVPLTSYLTTGSYHGIEIMRESVQWCRRQISRRFPQFQFHHADIANPSYNPDGRLAADRYQFPFPDKAFDFVILTSVFTHMQPLAVERYVGEIERVLKAGGRSFTTWFLLNDRSRRSCLAGSSALNFCFDFPGFRSTDRDIPERAIAYEEAYVSNLYDRAGLTRLQPTHYGRWSCWAQPVSDQDIIVATKPGTPD
jgi:SAM-dependent methyltransferase